MRAASDWSVDADEVAAAFGLGRSTTPMVVAAHGWGGHNAIYRLDTTAGSFAIKAMGREPDGLTAARFDIEMAAYNGGIPMPRPVPTPDGGPCAEVNGRMLRCHEWVKGTAKTNEDTTVGECRLMGLIVARLHGLDVPWSPTLDGPDTVEPGWAELADSGKARAACWAASVTDNLTSLDALSAAARRRRSEVRAQLKVGSHRDLNAHNVLFAPEGLSLVDWDAAGPIFPPWEMASAATLWAARRDGSYELDATVAFLAGYREGGGEISGHEPDTLHGFVDIVEGWTKLNLRWAVESPTPVQDENAGYLVEALLSIPKAVEDRRHLLRQAIGRMDPAP